MPETKKRRHIAFWIVVPLLFVLLTALTLFYLDLANGPVFFLVFMIISLGAFFGLSIWFINKRMWVRCLPFIGLLFSLCITLVGAKPSYEDIRAYDTSEPMFTQTLHLNEGDVQGVYTEDKQVELYAGVPYAKPPVGELRWKKPEPVDKWEGVKRLTHFASRSYQAMSNPLMDGLVDIYAEKSWHPNYQMIPEQKMSEDSLYLNIWRPADTSKTYPVLVYYHGGSLTGGSSAALSTRGETFARNGVIMITVAYRLGIFGYFSHPSLVEESGTTGNFGLLDQIQALRWVNDNCANFGGDKNAITIAGESAGSSVVSALCVSPLAKGLFRYAIGESSSLIVNHPPHTFRSLNDSYETGEKILKEFGVSSVAELRNVSASQLIASKYSNSAMTLDGYALTKMPYQVYQDKENNEIALLNGYNKYEADAFVVPQYLLSPTNKDNILGRLQSEAAFGKELGQKIYDLYKDKIEKDAFSAFNEIYSVNWFIYPHESWSKMAIANGEKVYRYYFTKDNGYYGAYHSGEIIYAYGNIERSRQGFAYDDKDKALSKSMVAYWTNFIKTGDPNQSDLPRWESADSGFIIEFGNSGIAKTEDIYAPLYPLIQEGYDRVKSNG